MIRVVYVAIHIHEKNETAINICMNNALYISDSILIKCSLCIQVASIVERKIGVYEEDSSLTSGKFHD